MAGAFAWIYARGKEAKPWLAQGVRYGIAAALLGVIPGYLIYYAVQPLPGEMVVKQVIFSGILLIVLGIIVAWLYRERRKDLIAVLITARARRACRSRGHAASAAGDRTVPGSTRARS